MTRITKSDHVQHKHNHHRSNYIVHVSNSIIFPPNIFLFIFFLNFFFIVESNFDLSLVEFMDVEPADSESQLYYMLTVW